MCSPLFRLVSFHLLALQYIVVPADMASPQVPEVDCLSVSQSP